MKIKKILGWTIIIAVILGLVLSQTHIFMLWEMSFLLALGLTLAIFLVSIVISVLIILAVKWITD